MGIKGLPAFLKKRAPASFRKLAGPGDLGAPAVVAAVRAQAAALTDNRPGVTPAVAVDVASLFYRLMWSADNVQAGCLSFMSQFAPLRDAGIRVLFVFDGPNKDNKAVEHARRQSRRDKEAARAAELRADSDLQDGEDAVAWMLRQEANRSELAAIEKRTNVIRPGDYATLAAFLTNCGWTTLRADGEGEAAAAWLEREGLAHAVISDDFDTLTCGARLFIRYYGSRKYPCEAVSLPAVLIGLGISYDMFVEFCVLCGSDFTHHLKDMGPVKALKCMHLYKSLAAYLASDAHKREYGDVHFDAAAALSQFRHLQPPLLTKAAAVQLLVAASVWVPSPRAPAKPAECAAPSALSLADTPLDL